MSRSRIPSRAAAALAAVALVAAADGPERVLNDGFTHVVDAGQSFPLDRVIVEDAAEGAPTALELMFRGEVGALEVRGSSSVSVSGGRVRKDLEARGRAVVRFAKGVVGDDLQAEGSADVQVSGGDVTQDLEASESARLALNGGRVGDDLQASGQAQVAISGGEILGTLEVSDRSVVTLTGSGFNHPPGDLFPLQGSLEGTLADGTPLDLAFRRTIDARIHLVSKDAPTAAQPGAGVPAPNVP